jgi:hypothetical protein
MMNEANPIPEYSSAENLLLYAKGEAAARIKCFLVLDLVLDPMGENQLGSVTMMHVGLSRHFPVLLGCDTIKNGHFRLPYAQRPS